MGITQNGVPIGTTSSLALFRYEPFSYTFTGDGGDTISLVSASTLVRALVTTSGSDIVFSSSGYTGTVSTAENIVLLTSSNVTYTVNISLSPGRFTSPVLSSFTLNKNTSVVTTYGSAIVFTSPIAISPPTVTPALPFGLSFIPIDSKNYALTGTPVAVAPTTSYTVYGFGLVSSSQVVTKTFTITVAGEAISLSIDGTSNLPTLTVDTPIPDRTITAVYPLSGTSNLYYTWSNLPDGIVFTDSMGNVKSSPFYPTDANSTLTLVGRPTLAAAQSFVTAGSSNRTVRVRATRVAPSALTADICLGFTFGPTVLFTSSSNIALYNGDSIDFGQAVVTAKTFFDPADTQMALIAAYTLPAGVALSYTPGSSNAYLTGTPTIAGSNVYTFTADNSNGVTRDASINIVVSNDIVTFTSTSPVNDVCYNFVISRPLNQGLTGYYPSSFVYSATASSTLTDISYSITNVPAGVSVNTASNGLTLTGIPNTITGLTTSTITALSIHTGATASRTLKWAVLNDVITVTNPATLSTSNYTYIQHRSIDPIQFEATTLSGRSISFWTPCNSGIYALPTGLNLSAQGKLSGAPLNYTTSLPSGFQVETFKVIASTGYTTGVIDVCYSVVQDYTLVGFEAGSNITVPDVFSNVEMYGLPYSGRTETVALKIKDGSLRLRGIGSNPTLAITNNMLSGDFTTADPLFPFYYFDVCGTFLGEDNNLGSVGVTVSNSDYAVHLTPVVNQVSAENIPNPGVPYYVPAIGNLAVINDNRFVAKARLGAISEDYASWNTNALQTGNLNGATDFCDVNVSTGNVAIAVAGQNMYRSVDGGQSWSQIASSNITPIAGLTGYYYSDMTYGTFSGDLPYMAALATDNSSNWVCLGRAYNTLGAERTVVRYSSNDGLTWTDDVINPPFLRPNPRTKMFYNNGLYFLTQPADASYSGVHSMDPVNVRAWTAAGVFQSSGGALGFASNGNTIMVGGTTDASSNNLYISSNNGGTWSSVPYPSTANSLIDLTYGDGKWVAFDSNAKRHRYSTDDGATWSNFLTKFGLNESNPADFMNTVYDKSGWFSLSRNNAVFPFTKIYIDGHNPDTLREFFQPFALSSLGVYAPPVTSANYSFKRMVYSVIKHTGPSTLTFMTPAQGFQESFIDPAGSSLNLYQFCPLNPPITVNMDAPVNYIWYWARNLPRGLSLSFPEADGDPAYIVGTPSQYSDAPQRVQLRAVTSYFGGHAYKEVDMRVILPSIMKKQDGAGSYTSYLRQYVTVNGAQAGRDSVALPTSNTGIGEFLRPGAPTVTTDSNCPC